MAQIEVNANINVKIRFNDYGVNSQNETALRQIKIWLEETLNDESQIPLFINTNNGEQTTLKKVNVNLTNPEKVLDITES